MWRLYTVIASASCLYDGLSSPHLCSQTFLGSAPLFKFCHIRDFFSTSCSADFSQGRTTYRRQTSPLSNALRGLSCLPPICLGDLTLSHPGFALCGPSLLIVDGHRLLRRRLEMITLDRLSTLREMGGGIEKRHTSTCENSTSCDSDCITSSL